jgi:hypothetical protein
MPFDLAKRRLPICLVLIYSVKEESNRFLIRFTTWTFLLGASKWAEWKYAGIFNPRQAPFAFFFKTSKDGGIPPPKTCANRILTIGMFEC